MDPELGKFKAGSGSGINSFGSTTLIFLMIKKFAERRLEMTIVHWTVCGVSGYERSDTLPDPGQNLFNLQAKKSTCPIIYILKKVGGVWIY